MTCSAVSVVVPEGVDDPARPSGGNAYDRRLCDGLRTRGWRVEELVVSGPWPRPDAAARERLAGALRALPDGALVLVDGLIASAARAVLVGEASRLRVVVLVHMPLGGNEVAEADEAAVLGCAAAVVTTSSWTRQRLLDRYRLSPEHVTVARPGADVLDEAPGTADGGRLLCVAAVVEHKGQDVLLEALTRIAPLPWSCTLVGSLDREPGFVAALRHRAVDAGIADRIRWTGAVAGDVLNSEYRKADLLVLPSRREAYGMVVTEALGAGLPVVATAVGGVPEALGRTDAGAPGWLVRTDDPAALAGALGAWLRRADLRGQLRRAAAHRRRTLEGWEVPVTVAAQVLDTVRRADQARVVAGA
jgi:glycosyltransferase involved in cell wall biosynthesis